MECVTLLTWWVCLGIDLIWFFIIFGLDGLFASITSRVLFLRSLIYSARAIVLLIYFLSMHCPLQHRFGGILFLTFMLLLME